MTKTEYIAAIGADLTAANALCAELRTLRNFKKIAKTIPDADKMVAFDVMDKAITSKEGELQKLPSARTAGSSRNWRRSRPLRLARPTRPRARKIPLRKRPPMPRRGNPQGKRPGLEPRLPRARRTILRRSRPRPRSLRPNERV